MWKLSPADERLRTYADELYRIFEATEDLELRLAIIDLTLDLRLKEDMGMDSIQVASILYELEPLYPHLNEDVLTRWKKLRDVLESMGQNL